MSSQPECRFCGKYIHHGVVVCEDCSPAWIEKLGEVADEIDNVISAASLPMPDALHLEIMKRCMLEWSVKLKSLYLEISGENPWDETEKS